MRAEERRAYVLGVLDACRVHKATEDAMAQACVDLGIAPEELTGLSKPWPSKQLELFTNEGRDYRGTP